MAVFIIVLSVAAPLCLAVVIFGCLNCFMKKKPGFSPFSNPSFVEEGRAGQHNDAFSVDMDPAATGNGENQVTIEALPDAASKSVMLPAVRPKIICVDRDSQSEPFSLLSSHRPFPRENLTYLNPLGVGWFGQAITTEALRITSGSLRSQVVVKILKDDATSVEEKHFIEEIIPYRQLDHPNVMSFLGQCTETTPYLFILEYSSHGDLKAFLQSHKQSMDSLLKKNKLLRFGLDAAAGVACMHRHNFVHCDLAARSCLVMSDYTLKIGDYGLGERLYKDDYFQTSKELLPIRWMAPECLVIGDGNTWSSQNYTKASDMWSFGVFLWEVFSLAELPYSFLTDEAVLQGVVIDKVVTPGEVPLRVPFHDRLSGLMNECWREPSERLSIEMAHQLLTEMSKEKVDQVSDEMDFDQKWNHLIPNTQSRSQSLLSEDGSAIALAGSFSSESPFNLDDKRSPTVSQSVSEDSRVTPKFAIDGKQSDGMSTSTVSDNEGLGHFEADNGQIAGDEISEGVSASSQLVIENQTKPPLQATVTPLKKENDINPMVSLPQMTTSTPRPSKNLQNDTSVPSFATEPNTSSTPYTTAQEALSVDSSLTESGDSNQNAATSAQDSDAFSSEGPDVISESAVEKPAEAIAVTGGQLVFDQTCENDNQLFGMAVEEEKTPFQVVEEEPLAKNDTSMDFSGFGNDVDEMGAFDISEQPVQSQQLDTNTDVLMPSLLSQNDNLLVTSKPQSQNSFTTDSIFSADVSNSHHSLLPTADSKTASPFGDGLLLDDGVGIKPLQFELTGPAQTDTLSPQFAPNAMSQDAFFSGDNSGSPLSSSNPFSMEVPSVSEDTTLTSSHEAFVQNKSEMDVSSSVNSSLIGWDTSIPDTQHVESLNQSHDNGSISPSQNTAAFTEGQKDESSNFAFLNIPGESDNLVEDSCVTDGEVTSQSLLSGFEPLTTDTAPPSLANNPMDDLFGLSSPSPQQPFVEAAFPTVGAEVSVGSLETSVTANANPFDMLAEFGNTESCSPKSGEVPESIQQDVFSPSFNGEGNGVADMNNVASFDFSGLDPVSQSSAAVADLTILTQEGDKQVGTLCKYDSSPDQSGDESGVNTHSLTDSVSAPVITSDSCYASVTDGRSTEATSEELSQGSLDGIDARQSLKTFDEIVSSDVVGNYLTEDVDSSSNDPVKDRLNAEEVSTDLDESGSGDTKTSPEDSEYSHSYDDSSSTSGSEREYICVNPFDTGQPPTLNECNDKENIDPESPHKDVSFEDLNEEDLRIVSELYLSKGVKSPRVFEVPALETIPEHQAVHSVTELSIPTPSETSSIGPRDDELCSDSYEWDDFYGDSLIGKEQDIGSDCDVHTNSSIRNKNISNWSLDLDNDSQHMNTSSELSATILNGSHSTSMDTLDKTSISDQCLSDSEVSKTSQTSATRLSLVASALARHRNSSTKYSSAAQRDKRNFYSLIEDFDFSLDSSQEDNNSNVASSDDDDDDDIIHKKSHLHTSLPTSSHYPSHSSTLPISLLPSLHSRLSPGNSGQVLELDEDRMKQPQNSPISSTEVISSPSLDLLGLGFDLQPSGQDNTTLEQSSGDLNDFSLI